MRINAEIRAELEGKYAQLIELSILCLDSGHGLNAAHPNECELCNNLVTLRRGIPMQEALGLGVLIHQSRQERGLS